MTLSKYKALRAFHFFQKNRFFCLQKGIFYWFLRFFVKKYFFRTIKNLNFFIFFLFFYCHVSVKEVLLLSDQQYLKIYSQMSQADIRSLRK